MSIAFIGVHRLINKMVSTCTQFSDSSAQSALYMDPSSLMSAGGHTNRFVNEQVQIKLKAPVPQAVLTPTRVKPLRVMRLMEKQSSPLNAGRMVMSGRFDDVCAELDRLIERQNQQISSRK